MSLVVYNTLGRRKEPFVPRDEGKVSIYVCGPTVDNFPHVGHGRSAIVFDVIRRYLIWRGFEVTYVENFTDIEDKIIARGIAEGRSPSEVAGQYSKAFQDGLDALGVMRPDLRVRATEHIPQMIEMIASLKEKGVAYESEGNVWFSVEKFPGYGKLSNRTLDSMRAGERVEPDPSKHYPLDFGLWKAAKEGEPSWESPWGPGRPGWHIECSAMSLEHLGMSFDIHGGGADLIFPHHENEIAQSEASSGEEPFCTYWLHNGWVMMRSEKMSKSLGNTVVLPEALKTMAPQVIRLMSIMTHYRGDFDYTDDQVQNASGVWNRFSNFARAAGDITSVAEPGEASRYVDAFKEAMDDDFNTPAALKVLHELIDEGNLAIEKSMASDSAAKKRLGALLGVFVQLNGVLGLELESAEVDPEVEAMVAARDQARESGNFVEADKIRDELASKGVVLEDTPAGTRWRRSTVQEV